MYPQTSRMCPLQVHLPSATAPVVLFVVPLLGFLLPFLYSSIVCIFAELSTHNYCFSNMHASVRKAGYHGGPLMLCCHVMACCYSSYVRGVRMGALAFLCLSFLDLSLNVTRFERNLVHVLLNGGALVWYLMLACTVRTDCRLLAIYALQVLCVATLAAQLYIYWTAPCTKLSFILSEYALIITIGIASGLWHLQVVGNHDDGTGGRHSVTCIPQDESEMAEIIGGPQFGA
mmetsp:Transcript_87343/g.226840  ORF Transcript_87343/g.226840 Transcript_87343/m.226840 type:complete len:231 (+) Transcript_87343:107-799(+)